MADVSEITTPTASLAYRSKVGTLMRVIGISGAMVFGVQAISLVSSGMLPISTMAGLLPGANLLRLLAIALFLSLIHVYTYAVMGAAAPTSGADYVLSSRVLNAPLSFAASWTLTIFGAWIAGSFVAYIPQAVIPAFMLTVGTVLNNSALIEIGQFSASASGIITIGTFCLVFAYILTLLPARLVLRTLWIGFVLVILAWVFIFFVFATSTGDSFPQAWNNVMGAGSYEARINLAGMAGLKPTTLLGGGLLPGLLLGFWIFYGSNITTHFAGEVKKPGRTFFVGSVLALVICWAIFSAAVLFLQRLVPSAWFSAESFLYLARAKQQSMPWIIFYAAVLRPNPFLLGVILLAWIYALINLLQTSFFYFSRIMVAWSMDHLMPEVVGRINPSVRSPIVALLIVAILAEFGLMDTVRGGFVRSQLSFIFCVVCVEIIPVIAVILFPFLKKDWFEASDPFVKVRLFKIPVITIIGLITLVYLIVMILVPFSFSPILGLTKSGALSYLGVFFLSGLAWYFIRRGYLRRKGRDDKDTFHSLPTD